MCMCFVVKTIIFYNSKANFLIWTFYRAFYFCGNIRCTRYECRYVAPFGDLENCNFRAVWLDGGGRCAPKLVVVPQANISYIIIIIITIVLATVIGIFNAIIIIILTYNNFTGRGRCYGTIYHRTCISSLTARVAKPQMLHLVYAFKISCPGDHSYKPSWTRLNPRLKFVSYAYCLNRG